MARFDGNTPKRHVIWSNDEQFIAKIVEQGGYLSALDKRSLSGMALATNKIDPKTGRKVFTGVRKRLKASQNLVSIQFLAL